MGTWNDSYADEILQVSSSLWREVEILQKNGSGRWATTASLEKEEAVGREGKCDVMLLVKIFVSSLNTIYDNMTGAKLAVPLAIKHISDNPIALRKAVAISHLLDHCWIMKESLKSGDKGDIQECASGASMSGISGLFAKRADFIVNILSCIGDA